MIELKDEILIHLQHHDGFNQNQCHGNIPYYLASAIFERHQFDTIESLIIFCESPNNMQSWLPSEADRIVFSDELVNRLREMLHEGSTESPMV